jgi:hypothetical protein
MRLEAVAHTSAVARRAGCCWLLVARAPSRTTVVVHIVFGDNNALTATQSIFYLSQRIASSRLAAHLSSFVFASCMYVCKYLKKLPSLPTCLVLGCDTENIMVLDVCVLVYAGLLAAADRIVISRCVCVSSLCDTCRVSTKCSWWYHPVSTLLSQSQCE